LGAADISNSSQFEGIAKSSKSEEEVVVWYLGFKEVKSQST
jgi:hypothetical protein